MIWVGSNRRQVSQDYRFLKSQIFYISAHDITTQFGEIKLFFRNNAAFVKTKQKKSSGKIKQNVNVLVK
jgi:hypothetical protein